MSKWLNNVITAAEISKGIVVDTDKRMFLLEALEALQRNGKFTVAQMRHAELWILCGDWTFRGKNPVLELSDFTPGADKIEMTARAASLIVMTVTERRKMCRDEYERGRIDGMLEMRKEFGDTDEARKDARQRMVDMGRELLALRQERTELLEKLAQVSAVISVNQADGKMLITTELEQLQKDYAMLAHSYQQLRNDANNYRDHANAIMLRLLKTKSGAQAQAILDELRRQVAETDERLASDQEYIDHLCYKVRVKNKKDTYHNFQGRYYEPNEKNRRNADRWMREMPENLVAATAGGARATGTAGAADSGNSYATPAAGAADSGESSTALWDLNLNFETKQD